MKNSYQKPGIVFIVYQSSNEDVASRLISVRVSRSMLEQAHLVSDNQRNIILSDQSFDRMITTFDSEYYQNLLESQEKFLFSCKRSVIAGLTSRFKTELSQKCSSLSDR